MTEYAEVGYFKGSQHGEEGWTLFNSEGATYSVGAGMFALIMAHFERPTSDKHKEELLEIRSHMRPIGLDSGYID